MARRDYAGGAVATTITSGINATDLAIPIAASTGWPVGTNGKFYVVVDRGLATEEKILVTSRSGLGLTVANTGDRGVDGTSAQTHSSGAPIEHCIAAPDVDEPNAHINDTAHLSASTIAGPGLGIAAGVMNVNVDNATLEQAADVNRVKDAGITAAKLASDSVTTVKIVDANVTTAKIANLNVTTGKLAANAVTTAKLAADAVTSTEIAADAVGSSEIAADAVGTAEIAADAVTTSELADDAVTTANILDGNVTEPKLADDAVSTRTIADGAVTAAKLDAALVAQSLGAIGQPVVRTTDAGPVVVADGDADVGGLTKTVTVAAGRQIRVGFNFRGVNLSGSTSDVAAIRIHEGATVLQECQLPNTPSGAAGGCSFYANLVSPSAGSHTYKITMLMLSGGGSVTLKASGTYPATLTVEDMGAS